MPVKNIKKQNVSDMVYQQLRKLITSGEWKPGEKIPSEITLADNMGVSRISVRAALQKLASVGVIERRQGHGTIVCEMDGMHEINNLIPMLILNAPDLETMNEFRFIIECGAAELAAKRATLQDIEEMEKNLHSMHEMMDTGQDCSVYDVEFHLSIARASGNSLIAQTETIMKDAFLDCMHKYQSIMGVKAAFYFHEKLLIAIRDKDPARAKQIMYDHLEENAMAIQTARNNGQT